MLAQIRKPNLRRYAAWLICLGLSISAMLIANGEARAGEPEYLRLNPEIGLGVEIKGAMNADGLFVASDIEALKAPRSPKLRGELIAVNPESGSVVVFGRRITVDAETQIEGQPLAKLTRGQRVEISCKIDKKTGAWRARSLSSAEIKASDKIKGTITEMFVNGTAPDTLSISGLLVLLDKETDLEEALLQKDERQKDFFGRLAARDARSLKNTHTLADGRMGLQIQYRHNIHRIDGFDLTDRFDSDREDTQPELRARWSGFWSDDVRTYVESRLRRRYILASDLDQPNGDLEMQVVQAYALWRNIAGRDFSVAAGRQEFDEEREWLYDEYLDAARVTYYGSDRIGVQASYIHAVKPLKEKFTTWTDLLLVVDYYLAKDNRATFYTLSRSDTDEVRQREPIWWGLRYFGEPMRRTRAWLELATMRGQDKHRDLNATAVDVGVTYLRRDLTWSPSLTVGYALGSGDEVSGDQKDGAFRQTGYQDNSARFGGVTSVFYYGALLDPELSNLSILTLGCGVRPLRDTSVDVFYHKYRQDQLDDKLRGDLIDPPARPNGQSDDIGWEVDLVVGLPRLWGVLRASWTLGIFEPGEAYSPRQDRAVLTKLNVTVEI